MYRSSLSLRLSPSSNGRINAVSSLVPRVAKGIRTVQRSTGLEQRHDLVHNRQREGSCGSGSGSGSGGLTAEESI